MLIGSLFSGAGLGDLGFMLSGMKHAWFCECNTYAQKVLKLRFPGICIYNDVKTMSSDIASVDIIVGGFPCQAFSTAASGRNIQAKDLSNIFVLTALKYKPSWIVGENVQARPVYNVAKELQYNGYKTTVFSLSSNQAGADHKRKRWWVVAHANLQSQFYSSVYAKMAFVQKLRRRFRGWQDYARAVRVSNGCANRLDRLKCLGNGQDPFITYAIGRTIIEYNKNM